MIFILLPNDILLQIVYSTDLLRLGESFIQNGPSSGKLAVIVDVADSNRVLIDGPVSITGVHRQLISLRWISLTDFKITVPLNAKAKTLKAALEADDIINRWENTSRAKKLNMKKRRAATTDFDRFKVQIARQQRSALVKGVA